MLTIDRVGDKPSFSLRSVLRTRVKISAEKMIKHKNKIGRNFSKRKNMRMGGALVVNLTVRVKLFAVNFVMKSLLVRAICRTEAIFSLSVSIKRKEGAHYYSSTLF